MCHRAYTSIWLNAASALVFILVEGQMIVELDTEPLHWVTDLEIGTLWFSTSNDDTMFVHHDVCAVNSTISSDLSGLIASPLLRNHWHSSTKHALHAVHLSSHGSRGEIHEQLSVVGILSLLTLWDIVSVDLKTGNLFNDPCGYCLL